MQEFMIGVHLSDVWDEIRTAREKRLHQEQKQKQAGTTFDSGTTAGSAAAAAHAREGLDDKVQELIAETFTHLLPPKTKIKTNKSKGELHGGGNKEEGGERDAHEDTVSLPTYMRAAGEYV